MRGWGLTARWVAFFAQLVRATFAIQTGGGGIVDMVARLILVSIVMSIVVLPLLLLTVMEWVSLCVRVSEAGAPRLGPRAGKRGGAVVRVGGFHLPQRAIPRHSGSSLAAAFSCRSVGVHRAGGRGACRVPLSSGRH